MKQILFTLIAISTSLAFGQSLPRASAAASVNQTVGLNEISVDYSRPSANNRVIFGDVVPYNEVWRLGANECTKFTCSLPIIINGKTLEAGTYSVYAIPTKNQWNVVFNTNTEQWGSSDYDATKNVLEYTAAVSTASHQESMSIYFESVTTTSANLVVRWANLSVSVPFSTDTKTAVVKEISDAIEKGEKLGDVYGNAADYFLDENELDKASMYIEKSLEIERATYNVFLKAQIVLNEDPKEARKLADEAIAIAEKAGKDGWVSYIKRKSSDWK